MKEPYQLFNAKKTAVLAGVASVIALGAATLPASANVLTQYQAVSNGTAGYYAIGSFHNLGAVIHTDVAGVNIGGVGKGGIGSQLCDPNTGFALQIGETSNGTTFSIQYAAGVLKGAAADNCVGDGVLPNPHILHSLLTGVPAGDNVQTYIQFRNVRVTVGSRHHRHRVWQGRALFQAFDTTSGFELYSKWVATQADWSLDSAGVGIQQDTTGMSACTPVFPYSPGAPLTGAVSPWTTGVVYNSTGVAGSLTGSGGGSGACNDVTDFSQVFANGVGGIFGTGLGLTHWSAVQVITTGGGLKANAAIVAPNDTIKPDPSVPAESAFSVYAGQVL